MQGKEAAAEEKSAKKEVADKNISDFFENFYLPLPMTSKSTFIVVSVGTMYEMNFVMYLTPIRILHSYMGGGVRGSDGMVKDSRAARISCDEIDKIKLVDFFLRLHVLILIISF